MSRIVLLLLASLLSGFTLFAQSHRFVAKGAEHTGILFSNNITDTDSFNMVNNENHWNGGGVSIGDINNDGLPDIFFTGNQVGNRLYLNKGELKFEDISNAAGIVANDGWNSGTVMADVNNDGFLDIYISRGGNHPTHKRRNLLFINNQDLTFSEQALNYGVADSSYSIQSTFFDFDNDGDLDLYVLNNQNRAIQVNNMYFKQDVSFHSNDILYRNDGGHFTDVSEQAGIKRENGLGLGLVTSDFNNDGYQDIFVANDLMKQDYYLINNGDGTFTDRLDRSFPHISMNSMGCDAADFNNDGLIDLLVVDMFPEDPVRQKTQTGITNDHYQQLVGSGYYHQFVRNVLQMNLGSGRYCDIAHMAGVAHTDWSWSPLFLDADNDGFKDIVITNSLPKDMLDADFQKFTMDSIKGYNKTPHSRAFLSAMDRMKDLRLPNYFFRNEKGVLFPREPLNDFAVNSNGMAFGDLDNDLDLDIVLNNLDTLSFILENKTENGNAIRLILEGPDNNRFGFGARAIAYSNGETQTVEITAARGYQSSSEPVIHFGLGDRSALDSIIIVWGLGKCSALGRIGKGIVKLKHGEAPCSCPETHNVQNIGSALKEMPDIGFQHKENHYDDFKVEPMLIRKLSMEGPKMASGDINADGLQDLYVGGTESGPGVFLLQGVGATYTLVSASKLIIGASDSKFYKDDSASLLSDVNRDGHVDLIRAKGGNEKNLSADMKALECFLNDGNGKFYYSPDVFPVIQGELSVLCSNDFDGDGWPDLFVGGRSVAGAYPTSPLSYLLKNNKGRFEDVTMAMGLANDLGMVTDAKWVDANNDNRLDLVIVGELMPPLIYTKQRKGFTLIKQDLTSLSGMWNCLEAMDIDDDGDMDLMLGNMGLNSKFKASVTHPFSIYYGDLDGNGSLDAIPTYYIGESEVIIPSRDVFLDQLYTLRSTFSNYSKFAKVSIDSILVKSKGLVKKLEAYEFRHVLLSNQGNSKFSVSYLPGLSQACNIRDMAVDDFNGDGLSDLIYVGNDFSFHNSLGMMDGCPGGVLLNDRSSGFEPFLIEAMSGLWNQDCRSISLVESPDGRNDYFVGINNGPLKLYRRK